MKKLGFSFKSGTSFAVDLDNLPEHPLIQFGDGCDDIETTFTGVPMVQLTRAERDHSSEVIRFSRGQGTPPQSRGKGLAGPSSPPEYTPGGRRDGKRPPLAFPARRGARKSTRPPRERMRPVYSFERRLIPSLFTEMMSDSQFVLPEPTRPQESHLVDHPLYCKYHRCVEHAIEDCDDFLSYLYSNLDQGTLTIPASFLASGSVDIITDTTDSSSDE